MKKLKLYFLLLFPVVLCAQETVNLAFYNVLNYPTAPPTNREEILADILNELQPDIFMVCELESNAGAQDILNNSLNADNSFFQAAPYFNNTSSTSDLQQLLYYDQRKFELISTDIIPTSIRDINRYRLKILTQDQSDPKFLEIFVSHLKASSGGQNEQLRLSMVEEFTDYLDTLNPDDYIVFAGDLNLYSSNEPAYQELLNASNPIVLIDPIDTPGSWNNNSNFAAVHTQSTRISNSGFDNYGAGGGLDSRFDFVLLSENIMETASAVSYVSDSYKAFGNNENCFNDRLDSDDCSGIYSEELRTLLYRMSDHLPVSLQLEVEGSILGLESLENDTLAWFVRNTLVDNEVEIVFEKSETIPQTITIIDQLGRIMLTQSVQGEYSLNVSTVDLSSGMYFITANGLLKPLRFIKK